MERPAALRIGHDEPAAERGARKAERYTGRATTPGFAHRERAPKVVVRPVRAHRRPARTARRTDRERVAIDAVDEKRVGVGTRLGLLEDRQRSEIGQLELVDRATLQPERLIVPRAACEAEDLAQRLRLVRM